MSDLMGGFYDTALTRFLVAVVQIIWINILLSGDNAVVIALACRNLPPKQRLSGMVLGTATALLMRLVFVGVVSTLMAVPYLKTVAGIALLWIAAKLVVPPVDTNKVKASTKGLLQAVKIIAIADVVMSLDNVIAVVAAAGGNVALLVFGLGISIPVIVAGATAIMAIVSYFPIIAWVGAALLGWIAGDMVATDPVVVQFLEAFSLEVQNVIKLSWSIAGGVGTLLAGLILRGRQTRSAKATQLPWR
jgi:YjbE family integral membrane protein